MNNDVALEAIAVSKRLRGRAVLDAVDLQVAYGQSVGIVGENGVGKSVLLRILAGLVLADRGIVRVGGVSVGCGAGGRLAPETGIVIDAPGFLPRLSGRDTLRVLARIRGRIGEAEIRDALALVGLDPLDTRPVRTYSLGMRQRLAIAQAVMERPRLLLLDEPTNGLDRDFQPRIPALLRKWQEEGMAIIWTSHDQALIEAMAPDPVWQLTNGRLVPSRQATSRHLRLEWGSGDILRMAAAWLAPMQVVATADARLVTRVETDLLPAELQAVLASHGITGVRIQADTGDHGSTH